MTRCPTQTCKGTAFVQRIHKARHFGDISCIDGKHLHLECLTCGNKFTEQQP